MKDIFNNTLGNQIYFISFQSLYIVVDIVLLFLQKLDCDWTACNCAYRTLVVIGGSIVVLTEPWLTLEGVSLSLENLGCD